MASITEPAAETVHSVRRPFQRGSGILARGLPKGLYARALIIIIAPVVLLQSVIAFVFMERHWQTVTTRLSKGTVQDIALLIDVYNADPGASQAKALADMASRTLNMTVQVLPDQTLPTTRPKPFFDLLDRALADEIKTQIGKPFWIDTVGRSALVEIRIKLDDKSVFRVLARRSQTYASNSQIFMFWMIGASTLLLTVAILFLRNQIKPILRLAEAADGFGKGHPVPADFKPRGAREVRKAAEAFVEMRERIERHVEQRTVMLAGVSHDLRTVLTRFKLQLAFFEDTPEVEALRNDVTEMQAMLEDYMAFAKGDTGEEAAPVAVAELLGEVKAHTHATEKVSIEMPPGPMVLPLRRHAFKRCVANLVNNAVRFADKVVVSAERTDRTLTIQVNDNGPGIPDAEREEVFRPFYRLDDARNQDASSTGLGLAIARDIARIHGGDIILGKSYLGGLRAVVTMPI